MERNPLISDKQTDVAAGALQELSGDRSVDPKVRLQAAETILGSAFVYEYPAPGVPPSEDEPEPEAAERAANAVKVFDGPGPGQSLSVTIRLSEDKPAWQLLADLSELAGGDVVEARVGPWYG